MKSKILVYGGYEPLLAVRCKLLQHEGVYVECSCDLPLALSTMRNFDVVVVCTSASDEAVAKLKSSASTAEKPRFVFLDESDRANPQHWLKRVASAQVDYEGGCGFVS